MSTDLIHRGAEYGIIVASAVALMFVLNHLGLLAWLWWTNRRRRSAQDSADKRYWSAHQ